MAVKQTKNLYSTNSVYSHTIKYLLHTAMVFNLWLFYYV